MAAFVAACLLPKGKGHPMSLASSSYKRLCKLYGLVVRNMRELNWMAEHGIPRSKPTLAAMEALEPKLLMSAAAFTGLDPATRGDWTSLYGAQGAEVVMDPSSQVPSCGTVAV